VKLIRLIVRNFMYKVVALVIAIVLWAATQGFRSVDESVDVALVFENQPKDLVVIGQSAREVNFKVVGSRWAVRRAEQELETYPVSLEGTAPGEIRFQVDPSRFSLPRGAEISAWSPSNVSIKLDGIIEKSVRVRADVSGELPVGFRLQGVEVEPSIVPLRGASSVLSRLREVPTQRVEIGDLRKTTSFDVPVMLTGSLVWPVSEPEAKIRVLVRVAPVPKPDASPEEDPGIPDSEIEAEPAGETDRQAPAGA